MESLSDNSKEEWLKEERYDMSRNHWMELYPQCDKILSSNIVVHSK